MASSSLAGVLAILPIALVAQTPQSPIDQHTPAPTANAPLLAEGVFRAPIHTMPADEKLGAYGVWASGDTYKVSFHDGFVFFPILGDEMPENLPLRWHTVAVTVGGEPIANLEHTQHEHSAWRYEYHFGTFVEAYDVLPKGVEQTFVIAAAPRRGDLVIEGRIETRLHAAPITNVHRELTFADDGGRTRVVYGEASVRDARGDVLPIATSFDGENVRLTVPASWLATASFPVTVDPLTTGVAYVVQPGHLARSTSIHREDESGPNNVMVAYTRLSSASDEDVYVRLGTSDFSSSVTVFTDTAAGWSSLIPDVSFAGGPDRWVVSFWRHNGSEDRVRVYFHDRDNTTFNSGLLDSSYNPGTEHATFPAIGANAHPTAGNEAMVVYRMDPVFGNTSTSQVHAAVVNVVARQIVGRIIVEDGMDAENPDINCQRGWGDDGYVVVYQGRTSAVDDYDVYARRIYPQTALVSPRVLVGPDNLGDKVRPVVQGWDGRYLVAMLQDVTPETNGQFYGRNVLTVRLDWPNATLTPTVQPHRNQSSSPSQDLTHLNLSFDGVTRSNWCLMHEVDEFTNVGTVALRLGANGGLLETAPLGAGIYNGSAVFCVPTQQFLVVGCAMDSNGTVRVQTFDHTGAAWHLPYGASCGGGQIVSDTNPWPGILDYRVSLQNAPPGQPAVLFLSFASGAFDLGPIGAPNCTANLGPIAASVGTITDATGACTITLALPDVPLFLGDLYWQYLYLWPAAPTPLPIGVTRGLRASVR